MPPGYWQPAGVGPVEVMPKFGGHSNLLLLRSRCGTSWGGGEEGSKTGPCCTHPRSSPAEPAPTLACLRSRNRICHRLHLSGIRGEVGKLTVSSRSFPGEVTCEPVEKPAHPASGGGRRAPCQMREPRLAGRAGSARLRPLNNAIEIGNRRFRLKEGKRASSLVVFGTLAPRVQVLRLHGRQYLRIFAADAYRRACQIITRSPHPPEQAGGPRCTMGT